LAVCSLVQQTIRRSDEEKVARSSEEDQIAAASGDGVAGLGTDRA
jgi:hypothetical protein